jgi:hypothetical protein
MLWVQLTAGDDAEVHVNFAQVVAMQRSQDLTILTTAVTGKDQAVLILVKETPKQILSLIEGDRMTRPV